MNYLENLESLVTDLKKKNEVLTKKLKEKGSSDKELTSEMARVRTEYKELNTKYVLLLDEYKKLDFEKRDLKARYDETVNNATKRISALQKKVNDSGNIDDVKLEKDSQIIILNNRIDELVEENARLRVKSKTKELSELKERFTDLENKLKVYKEEHLRYVELEKEKIALETKLEVATKKLEGNKNSKKDKEIETLNETITILQERLEESDKEKEDLELQLQRQKEQENEKFRQIQADIRELKKEYEEKYQSLKGGK